MLQIITNMYVMQHICNTLRVAYANFSMLKYTCNSIALANFSDSNKPNLGIGIANSFWSKNPENSWKI